MRPYLPTLAAALLALGASGCVNIFEPFDHPTSDAQLISAARACFNAGNYSCAQADYEKLSANQADIANSEEAMVAIDQINAGMEAFIAAFGQNNITTGKAITSIANSIGANASEASRIAVFNAYQKAILIQNTSLLGLTRFVTAVALAAEMLAENATVPGHLVATDIALAASCSSEGAACTTATNSDPCAAPNSSKPLQTTGAPVSGGTLDEVHLSDIQGTNAPLEVFNAAINTIQAALAQMGVGSTNANITEFTGAFAGFALAAGSGGANAPCYRQGLLTEGVGQ